jgi:uncharacterized membrane protein
MNWYITSLIAGIVMVVVGIVMFIFNMRVESVVFFILGGAFLSIDFTPEARGEFGQIPSRVLIKKIAGIVILLAGLIIFVQAIIGRIG